MKTEKLKSLANRLDSLETESQNIHSRELDTLGAEQIIRLINQEDRKAADIVERAIPEICGAAELAAESLRAGGRIIYVGAGTSGRLGVLDAAECPPTFGAEPGQVRGVIAGGEQALILSKEGAEDNTAQAVADITKLKLRSRDLVIGIAASTRTPYTVAALDEARKSGCKTAFIICNKVDKLAIEPDILISLPVGPEVITGSTRMKSGLVTKMALGMISTTAMVLLGKTYGNLMVDLQAKSEKLAARSRKILMDLLELDYDKADEILNQAGGSVKKAVVMGKLGVDLKTAETKLAESNGFVRRAIGE